jgi:hypothetical protein
MKRIVSVAAASLAVLLAGTAGAQAQQTNPAALPSGAPDAVVADTIKSTAKVASVDRAKRTVTLRAANGAEETLTLGPEVKNFDQIEVGDTVTAEYVEAVAVHVRAPGEPPSGAAASGIQVAPKGDKPSATMVQQEEMTATIEEIDYAKRTATLRNAQGKTRQINVDERIQNLDRFKKGDEIVISYTEAMAIAVTK